MKAFDRAALAEQLAKGVALLGQALSEAQLAQLIDYLALLVKWNAVYNLTAVRDPAQMVVQHLLDSLAAAPAFRNAERVLDVGAGGGLPGMVLAIALPATQVSMIDTVHKKTAFLTQVKAELGLANVTVHTGRVEELKAAHNFDAITSRAFADLSDFIKWSGHLLTPDGRFIAMKGVPSSDEEARVSPGWKVSGTQVLSVPGLNAERHLVFIERSNA